MRAFWNTESIKAILQFNIDYIESFNKKNDIEYEKTLNNFYQTIAYQNHDSKPPQINNFHNANNVPALIIDDSLQQSIEKNARLESRSSQNDADHPSPALENIEYSGAGNATDVPLIIGHHDDVASPAETITIENQALPTQSTQAPVEQKNLIPYKESIQVTTKKEQPINATANENNHDSKNHKRGSWNLWRVAVGSFVVLSGVLIIAYLKLFHYQRFNKNS